MPCFISARRARLNERLAAIDVKAKGGLLPDVMLEKGVRKTTMIVALARKLLIALWRLVMTGEIPVGVVLRAAG